MIELTDVPLAEAQAEAILRPVGADWSATTPAVRQLELAAGSEWIESCRAVGELPVGSAVITRAGALRAAWVIHVAVRSVEEPVGARAVERALRNGLRRAGEWGIREVALPLLGTGPGNLDPEAACAAMAAPLAGFVAGAERRVLVCVAGEAERRAAAARWLNPGGRASPPATPR